MWRRLLPVILLFFLTPLIAEFLLGNLPVAMIVLVLPLALMYGTGAVVIRELLRRTRRGWPSLVLLAVAYSLIEEGIVTQSLFNPNYLHLRLLDYGYIPALGIGLPWSVYVISLHVIWSICVPIGLVEALFTNISNTPWLGKVGLSVMGVLFVLGSALMAIVSRQQNPYLASPLQFSLIGIIIVALSSIAFLLPKVKPSKGVKAVRPSLIFCAAFIAGSVLMGLQLFAEPRWHWPWFIAVAAALILETIFIGFLAFTTFNGAWGKRECFAAMAGGLGVYLWFGFALDYSTHGAEGLLGHALIALIVLLLAAVAGMQTFRHRDPRSGIAQMG